MSTLPDGELARLVTAAEAAIREHKGDAALLALAQFLRLHPSKVAEAERVMAEVMLRNKPKPSAA